MIPPEIIDRIKNETDIVDLVGRTVQLKKTGKDFFGLCPFHTEKTASFSVNPDKAIFHCFGCGTGGDAIAFLQKIEGVTFMQAARRLASDAGIVIPDDGSAGRTAGRYKAAPEMKKRRRGNDDAIRSRDANPPAGELWMTKAFEFADRCHEALLEDDRVLRWLRRRGIHKKSVEKCFIGLNVSSKGGDRYRHRSSWGLPEEIKDNGKKKRLWLPKGVVIPRINIDGLVGRLRIRRNSKRLKYYIIPGSDTATWSVLAGSRCVTVVESELDGVLIDEAAGDLTDVIALGSSHTRPDDRCRSALNQAAYILYIPDFDTAGKQATKRWRATFRNLSVWPVPTGKDPGDAYKAGVDIREWITAGLPLAWRSGRSFLDGGKRVAAK